jgi:hypothetical protein
VIILLAKRGKLLRRSFLIYVTVKNLLDETLVFVYIWCQNGKWVAFNKIRIIGYKKKAILQITWTEYLTD